MKLKTIKKTITNKVEDWLRSIEDENLRDAVKRDLIITGGCIASMLLGQDVNDFDVYFKTKSTTKAVAEYYVKRLLPYYTNTISKSVIQVVDSTNIPTQDYTKNEDEEEWNKWQFFVKSLTRNKDEERIKIYIPHIGYWRREQLISEAEKYQPVYLSENAISLSDKIQIVVRFFGTPEEIHKNYDFIHATNYFHCENGVPRLITNSNALISLLTKELQYIGSRYPLTSVIRTKKFLKRGFTINAGTYLKILWQVSELDLKDPVELQEQLIGVDVAYFGELLDALRTVPQEKMSHNYVAEIIDRVFNDSDDDE